MRIVPISSVGLTRRFCLSGGKSHVLANSHGPLFELGVTQFDKWCVLESCTVVGLLDSVNTELHILSAASGSNYMANRNVYLRLQPSIWTTVGSGMGLYLQWHCWAQGKTC